MTFARSTTCSKELEGELPDASALAALEQFFAECEGNLQAKVDNYAAYITELTARAATREAEAHRLLARSRTDANRAAFLKDRLRSFLEERNVKKVECPRYTVAIVQNGGALPVWVFAPRNVPHDLCRHIPEQWEPDKDAIRRALLAGQEVPGAALQERGTHLRVR